MPLPKNHIIEEPEPEVLPDGAYEVKISDIELIEGLESRYHDEPQDVLSFHFFVKDHDMTLIKWVSNKWSARTNLHKLIKAVKGSDMNVEKPDDLNEFIGEKLMVIVEKIETGGKEKNKITGFVPITEKPKKERPDEQPDEQSDEQPGLTDEEIASNDIPF